MKRTARIAACAAAVLLLCPQAGLATKGDFFPAGQQYDVLTYDGHLNIFCVPQKGGNIHSVVDIHIGASPYDDFQYPLRMPETGTVMLYTTGARGQVNNQDTWGNSVYVVLDGGTEVFHLAHLDSVVKTGLVNAGEIFAYIGDTGTTNSHLHLSRSVNGAAAPVELSGQIITPALYPSKAHYISGGPLTGGAGLQPSQSTSSGGQGGALVGTWTAQMFGVPYSMEFKSDGSLILTVMGLELEYTYSVSGDQLSVTNPYMQELQTQIGLPEGTGTFSLSGNQMLLDGVVFTRFK